MTLEKKIAKIREISQRLSEITTHPEYLKLLDEIKKMPQSTALEYAKNNINPQELKKRGIPIPEDFKITTRVFENPAASVIHAEQTGQYTGINAHLPKNIQNTMTICGSLSAGGFGGSLGGD